MPEGDVVNMTLAWQDLFSSWEYSIVFEAVKRHVRESASAYSPTASQVMRLCKIIDDEREYSSNCARTQHELKQKLQESLDGDRIIQVTPDTAVCADPEIDGPDA